MAVSKWFDVNVYMNNKLAQMKADDADGNWTMDKVVDAFEAIGFVGAEGAEAHFMQFGQFEDVAPNAFFNPTEYYRAKAAEVNDKQDNPKSVTDAEAAFVKAAIKGLGMGAWGHYDAFGSSEGVNPSNGFDTEKYMLAKMDALNANLADGQTAYKIEDVYAAFKASGISALEHFMEFGGDATKGEVPFTYDPKNPTIPSEFAVDANKQVNGGGVSEGKTYTLTTGIDDFVGTNGNDLFIGDNSGSVSTATAGDQINGGAGTDTFTLYSLITAPLDTLSLPNMTSIEKLILQKGTMTTGKIFNASALAGVESVEIVNPITIGNATNFTIKASSDQTIGMTGANVATGGTGTINLDGVSTLALNASGTDSTNNGALTFDLTSTGAALNIETTGAASKITLANTGAKLETLTISGSKNLSLIESINGLKTIDASDATGNVSVNASGATLNANFAFTGGAGADTLTVGAGALALLDSGSQLDGGAGNDTLVVMETGALTAAQIAKVNATEGFEVLAFGAGGSGVDVSALTSINQFKVGAGNLSATFTNADSTSKFFIDNSAGNTGTVKISNLVGENATSVTIDTGSAGAGKSLTALDVSGISTVSIESLGVSTKAGAVNTITTLTNTDNTAIAITGDTDLSITSALAGAAVGSKVDAKDFTGKLTVTGSGEADTFITGTGGSVLTGSAGFDGYTLGSGTDKYVMVVAGTDGVDIDTITGFQAGKDKLMLGAGNSTAITSATFHTKTGTGNSANAANQLDGLLTDLATACGTTASGDGYLVTLTGGVNAGTYFVYENGTTSTASITAADQIVKLVGTEGTITAGDILVS